MRDTRCNADLDSPCTGGEDGEECQGCAADYAYWKSYYGGLTREQLGARDPRSERYKAWAEGDR